MPTTLSKIFVNSKDHGFLTEEPITVQSGYWEDGEFVLEECNHAGYIVERVESEHVNPRGQDMVWYTTTHYCDKENCGAYRFADDGEWRV
jgi:hypothetical protein